MKKVLLFLINMIFLVLLVEGVSALTEISNCDELQAIPFGTTDTYNIINDIDCSEIKNFIPIVNFRGTLDGQNPLTKQNHIISNLYIETDFAGLFHSLCGGTLTDPTMVKNIIFKDVTIIETNGDGGVILGGINCGGVFTIENINVENGNVLGGDYEYAGGLVGRLSTGSIIRNCHFSGTVEGAGGLVGQNDGTITNSSFSGTVDGGKTGEWVNAGPNLDKEGITGGLVGWNFGTIDTSYSEGTVIGKNNIGGFVGGNERVDDQIWPANIYDSYSTANVEGLDYKGGFMGYNVAGDIKDCYSTGTVTDSIVAAQQELMTSAMILETTQLSKALTTGGFLGYIDPTYECVKSFWDTETSGQTWSDCEVYGKTTAKMKNPDTYASWNHGLWFFPTADYPCLLGQENCIDSDEDGVLDKNDICPQTPEGEEINTEGCSCSQLPGYPLFDDGNICSVSSCEAGIVTYSNNNEYSILVNCLEDQCVGENWIDWTNDGYTICTNKILNEYICSSTSTYNVNCDPDDDNDGVLDADDICPNTPTEEEVITRGCSCSQILEKKPGEDTAENRQGCSKGLIDVFTKAIGWAKDF